MRLSLPLATFVATLLVGAAPLAAQSDPVVVPRQNVLSTNPILFVFGWYTLEYERQLGAATTIALGGSYFEYDDDDIGDEEYATADLKLRYYPNERVFRGFSIGASAGVARVEEVVDIFSEERRSVTAPTVGLAMDYGWLIGRRDNIHVDLGIGARRAFYGDEDSDFEFEVLPYLRLSVGLAW